MPNPHIAEGVLKMKSPNEKLDPIIYTCQTYKEVKDIGKLGENHQALAHRASAIVSFEPSVGFLLCGSFCQRFLQKPLFVKVLRGGCWIAFSFFVIVWLRCFFSRRKFRCKIYPN